MNLNWCCIRTITTTRRPTKWCRKKPPSNWRRAWSNRTVSSSRRRAKASRSPTDLTRMSHHCRRHHNKFCCCNFKFLAPIFAVPLRLSRFTLKTIRRSSKPHVRRAKLKFRTGETLPWSRSAVFFTFGAKNSFCAARYHLVHFGAKLKGVFSRYEYQRNPSAAKSAVAHLRQCIY